MKSFSNILVYQLIFELDVENRIKSFFPEYEYAFFKLFLGTLDSSSREPPL
jgi:hypothetical protein